jgi:hypothetical protein
MQSWGSLTIPITYILFSTAFHFASLYMIKIALEDSNDNLRGYTNSPYLLVSPLLQPLDGQKLVKVSGTVGDVDSEWREPSPDLQRITRTLDAFQHFVMMKTQGKLLISDLQGIYYYF